MLFFAFPYPPNASVGHSDPTCDETSALLASRSRNPIRDTTGSSETNGSSESSKSLHQAVVWLADPTLPDAVPGMELLMRAHIFLHDNSPRWKEVFSRQRIVQCLREVENSLCTLSLLHQSSGAGCKVKRCYQSYLHKKKLGRLEKAINVYLDCVDASSVSPSFPDSDHGNPETVISSDPPAYYPTSSDWNRSELTIRSDDLSPGGNQDQGRDQLHSIDVMSASSRDSGIASPTLPFKFSPCCEECLTARMPLAWVGSIMNRIKEEGSPYQCLARDGPSPKSRPSGAPSTSRSRSGRRRSKKTQSEKDSYHHLTRSQSIDSDSDCQFDDKESYSEVDALLARRRREQESLYNDSEYMYYMCLCAWM
ncbi:hypothetical protein D9758_007420 [Tetrapyrgos nigripes]|uniref:Uncharacterized protein n=1 Tax=Tetrapyrgos nigripes TaxID=182062 RepID=A0A8H5G3K3_9AGAR|nr:hypothetical protein D9758_007420 [Tetrapyrgos nigripes]